MKKHKTLIEFIKKESTEDGAISIMESINFTNKIWKIAKNFWYDCYLKAYPKSKLNYEPTNKKYKIKSELWKIKKK